MRDKYRKSKTYPIRVPVRKNRKVEEKERSSRRKKNDKNFYIGITTYQARLIKAITKSFVTRKKKSSLYKEMRTD